MVKDVSFRPANDAMFRPEVAKANVGDFKSSKVAVAENSRVLQSEPATTPDKSLASRAVGYFFTPFSYLSSYVSGATTTPSQSDINSDQSRQAAKLSQDNDSLSVDTEKKPQEAPSTKPKKVIRRVIHREVVTPQKPTQLISTEARKQVIAQAQAKKQEFLQSFSQINSMDSRQEMIDQLLDESREELGSLEVKSNTVVNDVFIKRVINKQFAASELISFKLTQLFGLDGLVPATVVKDDMVASVYVSGIDAEQLQESERDQVLCKDQQLFDFITGQSDRAGIFDDDQELSKNMLVLPSKHVVLIDNEFSFDYGRSTENSLPNLTPSSIKEIFHQDPDNFLKLLTATQYKSEIADWIFDKSGISTGAGEGVSNKEVFIARMVKVEQELKDYIKDFMGKSVLEELEQVLAKAL